MGSRINDILRRIENGKKHPQTENSSLSAQYEIAYVFKSADTAEKKETPMDKNDLVIESLLDFSKNARKEGNKAERIRLNAMGDAEVDAEIKLRTSSLQDDWLSFEELKGQYVSVYSEDDIVDLVEHRKIILEKGIANKLTSREILLEMDAYLGVQDILHVEKEENVNWESALYAIGVCVDMERRGYPYTKIEAALKQLMRLNKQAETHEYLLN